MARYAGYGFICMRSRARSSYLMVQSAQGIVSGLRHYVTSSRRAYAGATGVRPHVVSGLAASSSEQRRRRRRGPHAYGSLARDRDGHQCMTLVPFPQGSIPGAEFANLGFDTSESQKRCNRDRSVDPLTPAPAQHQRPSHGCSWRRAVAQQMKSLGNEGHTRVPLNLFLQALAGRPGKHGAMRDQACPMHACASTSFSSSSALHSPCLTSGLHPPHSIPQQDCDTAATA